jgi:phosphoglycolate phosphatase
VCYSLGVTMHAESRDPRYQAVLFDLDGTLLDTLRDLADAMNEVLTGHDLPTHPLEAYKLFVGDGIEFLTRRAFAPQQLDAQTLAARVAEMKRVYKARGDASTRPYDGIEALLDALVERGLRLAILSNKPHDAVHRLTDRLLTRWPFDPIWGARPEVPAKPDPTAALQIIEQTQIPGERWLYLGDTGIDMRTAVATGMTAVGVLWGFRGAQELRDAGADHLIEAPGQLLDLF